MVKKSKTWLSARWMETSTKWGIGIGLLAAGLMLFVSQDQLGIWGDKLTLLAGMAASYKLIVTRESPAK